MINYLQAEFSFIKSFRLEGHCGL